MKESQGDLLTGLTSVCKVKISKGENGGRPQRGLLSQTTYLTTSEIHFLVLDFPKVDVTLIYYFCKFCNIPFYSAVVNHSLT